MESKESNVPNGKRIYTKWLQDEKNQIIDYLASKPLINWTLNKNITAAALINLKIKGRSATLIRAKVKNILKNYKAIHRKRMKTGQGDIPGTSKMVSTYRYEDLEKICGSKMVEPRIYTLITAGEEDEFESGGIPTDPPKSSIDCSIKIEPEEETIFEFDSEDDIPLQKPGSISESTYNDRLQVPEVAWQPVGVTAQEPDPLQRIFEILANIHGRLEELEAEQKVMSEKLDFLCDRKDKKDKQMKGEGREGSDEL